MMICFSLTQLHLFVVDFLHFRLISKFKIDIIVIYIDLWWTVVKKQKTSLCQLPDFWVVDNFGF